SHRLQRLCVSSRRHLHGRRRRPAYRRIADHFRRAAARCVQAVERRPHRVADYAVEAVVAPRAYPPQPHPSATPPEPDAMTPQATPGLSVFFPAYNDSGTIASLVIKAVAIAGEI